MRTNVEPPALIFGGGITALGTLRNLGRRGVTGYVVGAAPAPYLRASRWFRSAQGVNREPVTPADLSWFLESLPLDRAVPIPCADDWQLAVSGLPDALIRRFPTCGPPLEATRILVDKEKLAQSLRELGIPHARTVAVNRGEGLPALDDSFFRDVILKPRNSKLFLQRFGTKGYRCRDRAEAQARFAETLASDLPVVLQEYVPGPPTSHCFIDGFIDRAGKTCARFARQRLRMYPPDLGNSTFMVSVPISTVGQAAGALDHLLAALRYRGTFSAEFKKDDRDGIYKLIEVNCRQWWYVGFAAACGVNVTWMTYQDALGIDVTPVDQYRVGVYCVHPHQDVYVCSRLRREGRLGLWSWARSWLGSRQPILSCEDPLPALASLSGVLHRRAGGRVES